MKIKKGLDLPIEGVPEQAITDAPKVTKVALVGDDYNGMKPTMLVQVGDEVKIGQPLFEDKKVPGVLFTSPGAGKITELNRGERRIFQSLVIELAEEEESIDFGSHDSEKLSSLGDEVVRKTLIDSGSWTAFKTRPFSKSPAVDSKPRSIFVTAMDSSPLAANAEIIINQHLESFNHGLDVLTNLTEGHVNVCRDESASYKISTHKNVRAHGFSGKHPAGLAGTHIHFIDPVSMNKVVWSINYQDVIAIGKLFTTGKIWTERVISLAGPLVKSPKLYRTRMGCCISELIESKYEKKNSRIISGSILNGRTVTDVFKYLGKFHGQITIMNEGTHRDFLGWMSIGASKYSVAARTYLSSFIGGKPKLHTNLNGSPRAIVPIGAFEKVMPLDILPTQLLVSLASSNLDLAQTLGCLELEEEDLALCTFIDPSKGDYGPLLRDCLRKVSDGFTKIFR